MAVLVGGCIFCQWDDVLLLPLMLSLGNYRFVSDYSNSPH